MIGAAGGSTMVGVAFGMAAGALWGLVFLAPELVPAFSPLQLAAGRYFVYGLISGALIAPRWRMLRDSLKGSDWATLGWLAFAGNTLYYALLTNAVQMGGIATTSLVIGFLPVAVTIAGSRVTGAVPLRRLMPSLLLCTGGAICIGVQALATPPTGTTEQQLIGLLCAIGALVSWTIFAIGNRAALARLGGVSAYDWNLLTGVVTGLQSLVLIPAAILFGSVAHDAMAWAQFAGVSIGIAVLASIIGNALESHEPDAAPDPGGPDDPVRNLVCADLRLRLGATASDPSGDRRLRAGGAERPRLSWCAPHASATNHRCTGRIVATAAIISPCSAASETG